MSEEKTIDEVKKENTDKPKKGGCLKGCLTLIILFAILGGLINACFGGEDESTPKQDATKQEKVETATKPKEEVPSKITWQDKVKEIAAMEGTPTDKYNAIMLYAKEYSATEAEIKEFEKYIINEYTSKKYVADINNAEYMLSNVFRANSINRFYGEVMTPINNFAFDFYQNTKYTYRGVDSIDSEAVKYNEQQMDKALKKIEQ